MRNGIQTILIIILFVLLIFGGYWIVSKIRLKPQPPSTPVIQFPQITTTTLTTTPITVLRPLLDLELLKTAQWKWSEDNKGGYYKDLPKETKIYMPFEGYIGTFYNQAFSSDEVRIYNKDKTIEIQLVGNLNINPQVKTAGVLYKPGTLVATVKAPTEKQKQIFGLDKPFLVIYAYRNDKLDPNLLKELQIIK